MSKYDVKRFTNSTNKIDNASHIPMRVDTPKYAATLVLLLNTTLLYTPLCHDGFAVTSIDCLILSLVVKFDCIFCESSTFYVRAISVFNKHFDTQAYICALLTSYQWYNVFCLRCNVAHIVNVFIIANELHIH